MGRAETMTRDKQAKLDYWKSWVDRNEEALGDLGRRMDEREKLYRGEVREITPLTPKDMKRSGQWRKTSHLRNIIAENIESEVSAVIPQPSSLMMTVRVSASWSTRTLISTRSASALIEFCAMSNILSDISGNIMRISLRSSPPHQL